MKPEDGVVDESSLDPEALQAQIDLSMSFAQDLVSSWLDPSKFSKSSRKNDLEKELTDYMRRPPRLGVGATVPAGHQASMSRETARLKGKLAGTKRPRDEEATTSKLPAHDDEDDEGESKARAIKKKAKVDPFDVVHGKKKKKQKQPTQEPPTPVKKTTPPPPPAADEDSSGEVADILLKSPAKSTTNDTPSVPSSPKKSKKKKKKALKETNAQDAALRPLSDSERDMTVDPLSSMASKKEKSSEDQEKPQDAKDEKIKSKRVEEGAADSTLSAPSSPKKKGSIDVSKIPLLNLTGPPPSDDESGADADGAPATSPKKKRKRRKKKKGTSTNTNENDMDVDDA